jgi:Tfp pilus assembly protein PilF
MIRTISQKLLSLATLAGAMVFSTLSLGSTDYVGTATCAGCHEQPFADWQGSHHDLAMQAVTEKSVLGNFNDATFTYAGTTSTFYRKDDAFWVRTDNAAGELEDFRVAWVFGVFPLQQYLLPIGDGKLQALTIAWDARSKSEGGQRWYHLYPDDAIKAGDPLHWTGPYQNWNTRCAECHSTNVQKHYNPTEGSFATTWDADNVGCEGCHGPGAQHVALVKENTITQAPYGGFEMSLAAKGQWAWAENASIAHRNSPLTDNIQIDNCARCHARRSTLGDYHYGADLLDTHRLSLIEEPLYWPDGQIRDEVYVYGSFVQSKMHQAGVACTNCHNPHSNTPIAEGNGLCAQCHMPTTYDSPQHHRHAANSTGAQCVECHMPAQLYMGVDSRRDHSMRIPRPDLSLMTGSPNACTQCHTDQSNSWALDSLRDWGIKFDSPRRHPAMALRGAHAQDIRSRPSLKKIIDDTSATPILRASALVQYGNLAPPDLSQTAGMLLASKNTLLRSSAVRASAPLPPTQRYLMLRTLINDPVQGVRMAVAEQLASTPLEELRQQDLPPLLALFSEYERVLTEHADMPSSLLQLANYWLARGDIGRAEASLREALRINPQLDPARVNLADVLRAQGRDNEARALLKQGIATSLAPGALHHSLGLLEFREGNGTAAITELAKAAELEAQGSRHRYVYAIALHDTGQPAQAFALLEQLNQDQPGNPEVLSALISYAEGAGDVAKQGRYQGQLQGVLQSAGVR